MIPPSRCHISINKPFEKTILSHPFNHRVDFVLPTDLYQLISKDLNSCPALGNPLRCWRLCVPLLAILEMEFLAKYVKTGNVVMLSQGRIDVDNVYSLNDGLLRLSLHKETYEKAGLVGRPTRFGNAAGKKKPNRYLVEINLRDPCMLQGKKPFERIIWSFTNVLKEPVNFLFCDLNQDRSSQSSCPILAALSALPREIQVPQVVSQLVLVPSFYPPIGSRIFGGGKSLEAEYQREVWREWALHIHEWLALTLLGPADRIKAGDSVDPYLSTYSVDQTDSEDGGRSVTRLTFRGMVPAPWINEIWKAVCNQLSSSAEREKEWAMVSVHGFENSPISWNNSAHGSLTGGDNGYTILRLPVKGEEDVNERYMIYEVLGSQDEHS